MTSILKVNTIQDIGGNTLVSSNGTGGFTNNLPAGKSGAFRNIIINGDMSIAQRGTSQATAGSAVGSYQTLDRWKFYNNNQGAFTWSQDTDVPTGQGFAKSMKLDCTTADASPAAADYLIMEQSFEGQNLQYLKKGTASAESLTMSFWVKSNKTGTYIAGLFDSDNTRQISKAYTIDASNTWEKKTVNFVGDTTGTLNNDNGKSLVALFFLGGGTDITSGTLATSWESYTGANRAVGQVNLADNTANNFWITGVQLEAGTTASDFEFLPVDVNLQRCQRYFIKYNVPLNTGTGATSGWGSAIATTLVDSILSLPVTMRVSASSMSLGVNTLQMYIVASSTLFSGGTFTIPYDTNNNNITIRYTHGSGVFTVGQTVGIVGNLTTGFLTLSAEL